MIQELVSYGSEEIVQEVQQDSDWVVVILTEGENPRGTAGFGERYAECEAAVKYWGDFQ